ncbi:alpha-L-fucosidase [Tamlana fucoidanivorans]|uniref:alpha-L-fucosidase n=1 Tax=Allotamlana fucoidanivorans TaxID=2583814 RepID=A0A5C4SD74_9FLAO|nr:alpha-L-fucosidase [Tamlana fucoidanivorans]TNJ41498.1 alpha-L-fucosidase [Tamlana fucoidanivorans]
MKNVIIVILFLLFTIVGFSQKEIDTIGKYDIWNLPELPIYPGAYEPNWESLKKYEVPEWFREAKLGIWSHWNPQSVPEAGGWYARWMYIEGDRRYEHGIENYGHPSEFGYKDICVMWSCNQWDPDAFLKMAVDAGGKYFVALANHHDNYDSWNSIYQPWNSVNIGPKKDVIAIWKAATEKYGLPFGVSVHASPARTWGQFMPNYFGSDKEGKYKGVPYDAATVTFEDGRGTAWEGLDPKDLYGFPHDKELDANQSPFANQFMWRVDDLLKYNPDLLYFDESVGVNGWVDLGVKMGFGHLAPQIAANYYNKSMAMNSGEQKVVLNMKGVGGRANSLYTIEEAEIVANALVKDSEKKIEGQIEPYPFQTDDAIGPWFINKERLSYKDAKWVIHTLINNVSKNGNLLLAIPQRAQGNVDLEAVEICKNIGAWMRVNGEGIYGSRPFEIFKSNVGSYYFTRREGYIYMFCLDWPKSKKIAIPELKKGGATIGNVLEINLLGSKGKIVFKQDNESLIIEIPNNAPNKIAAVFKLKQDKTWINDDDPGVGYFGWIHKVNRDNGEFNNDVHESYEIGERCTFLFEGIGIDIVANTSPNMGVITILIDNELHDTVDLSKLQSCGVQQTVFSSKEIPFGKHKIDIINATNKLVAIDALIIK